LKQIPGTRRLVKLRSEQNSGRRRIDCLFDALCNLEHHQDQSVSKDPGSIRADQSQRQNADQSQSAERTQFDPLPALASPDQTKPTALVLISVAPIKAKRAAWRRTKPSSREGRPEGRCADQSQTGGRRRNGPHRRATYPDCAERSHRPGSTARNEPISSSPVPVCRTKPP
jgi:hypothetical protein